MNVSILNRIKTLWQRCRSGVLLGFSLGTLIYIAIAVAANLSSQTALAGLTVNVQLTQEGSVYLHQALGSRTELEGHRRKVLLADAQLEAFEALKDLGNNYYALQAILSLYENQELDIMLMDQVAMENFFRQEIFLDLRNVFEEDELNTFAEMVIFGRCGEEMETTPLVLDVTDLPFIRDHVVHSGKVYFAVMNNTQRLQACKKFWEIVVAWEDTR